MFCTYDWLSSLNIKEVTAFETFDLFFDMMTSSTMWLAIFLQARSCSNGTSSHLHINFDDHIWNGFRVITKKYPFFFKHEYRWPNLSSCCDVIDYVIMMKHSFAAIIRIWSFRIWCQIKAVLNILQFTKTDEILRSYRTVSSEVSPEVEILSR